MTVLILFVCTFIPFLFIDIIGIKMVIGPMFERNLGAFMLEQPKMGAALIFYVGYVLGFIYFVSLPNINGEINMQTTVLNAFLFGVIAYGTFEFTSYSVFDGWTLKMLVMDTLWGGILTTTSVVSGLFLFKLLNPS